jgi:hypothetical protein
VPALERDRARRDAVDAEAILRQLSGHRFREADLGGLDGVCRSSVRRTRGPRFDAIIRITPPPALRMIGTARRDMRMAGNSV